MASAEWQRRRAQWRYQQRYQERLRRDQLRLQNWRYSDYGASNYRYNRGGRYYETNQYGAQQLRQAVNLGYEEGYRAGQADREDGWRAGYQDSYGYQDATYGYDGYYVNVGEYSTTSARASDAATKNGYYSRSQSAATRTARAVSSEPS